LQRDAQLSAGVDERHLFEDRASGSRHDRTDLATALAFLKPRDCLVVGKLDRLGRSLVLALMLIRHHHGLVLAHHAPRNFPAAATRGWLRPCRTLRHLDRRERDGTSMRAVVQIPDGAES
jgi:Resolvase, N terminal domain